MATDQSNEYVSLASLLQGHWEKSQAELPAGSLPQLEDAFFPLSWDECAGADRRKAVVANYDAQRDPAQEAVMKAAFENCERIKTIEQNISDLKLKVASTRAGRDEDKQELLKLQAELATVNAIIDQAGGLPNALEVAPNPMMNWIKEAKVSGSKITKSKPKLNVFCIAKKIHEEFCARAQKGEAAVLGRGNRVPSASTIKREALTGIKK